VRLRDAARRLKPSAQRQNAFTKAGTGPNSGYPLTENQGLGASATVSVNWLTTGVQKGQHTIKATADRNNAVTESIETNNTKSLTVSIQGSKT
jgi:hypothetical protein